LGSGDRSELRPVELRDGEVVLIDQRALPWRLRRIRCRTYREVAKAIRDMAVRGAPAIGVAAAAGMALAAMRSKGKGERILSDLERAAEVLRATRPTGANLQWAISRILSRAREASPGDIARAVLEEARRIAEEDVEANRRLGAHGAALLGDGDRVLTHCNWPIGASGMRGPSPRRAMGRPWAS
jgi:methylthioribose-1-phosphate isomerase